MLPSNESNGIDLFTLDCFAEAVWNMCGHFTPETLSQGRVFEYWLLPGRNQGLLGQEGVHSAWVSHRESISFAT
jgi:hypothetical protein